MLIERLRVTHRANVLTAVFFGTFVGVLALPACSPSGASNPDVGSGGSGHGARPGGGGGSANSSSSGASAGNNVGGFGNNNPGGGFGNGGVGPSNGGDNPGGGFVGSGGGINPGSGGSGPKVWTDPDAANPARNQVPGGQVCGRLSTIQCAGEAFCCDAPGRSYDQCKQSANDACVNSLYLNAITADPIAGYDGAGAEAIFAEYEQLASTCDPTVTSWGASLQGLRGLAKGTLQSGQSCEPQLSQLTNKPVAAAHLAACTNAATTACYPTTLSWTCSPRANANSKCFADTNCNDGLYCDNPNLAIAGGTCKLRRGDGSACTLANQCGSLLCKQSQCASVNQQTAFCLGN